METKLILCDLDGTLLHSDKTISDYSKSILERCKENGILVGFSTSRGRTNIVPYEKLISPDVLICNGGASIIIQNELRYTCTFTIEETRALLDAAYKVCGEDAEITVDLLDKILWNRTDDKKSTDYAWNNDFDDFKNFNEPAMKICVQTEDPKKAAEIGKVVPDCDILPFSDIPWYKFSCSNATKENGIRRVCELLNIKEENIIAFGDDHNDIGMLKMCGKGIAMQNAIPEVKTAADGITEKSNDEDGVAFYLEKHVL